MTLNDYTEAISDKTGQRDAVSIAVYERFVNKRYRMLWDRLDWNDALNLVSASATAGNPTVDLPASVDRVLRIRWVDHFLDPITDGFFIETDPLMFERQGIPQYYQEGTEAGARQIRLYPTPNVDGTPLIEGKKVFQPLVAATDTPILRNIDNCLLAYAMGDGLERQRQYGMAKLKFDEGAMLFTELTNLEKQQTNVPRRSKHLSVQGDTLAEMTDAVCARIGDYTPATRILVEEFLREEYRTAYDACLWPESLVPFRAVSDGSQVILPDYIDRVISVRADDKGFQLGAEDISTFFAITPQIFEQVTGPTVAYSLLTPVGVYVLPPLQERLAFVSTDPMDKTEVFVRGESSGQIYEESVQLNGTSPVYTMRAYDVPLTVAKTVTHGDITVNGANTGALLQTLFVGQSERKHMRLWIQANSGSTHNCLILGKRKITSLVAGSDTPQVRNMHNILVNGAVAAISKDPAMVTKFAAKSDTARKILLEGETNQQTRSPRVIPYVESYMDYADNCEGWFLPER